MFNKGNIYIFFLNDLSVLDSKVYSCVRIYRGWNCPRSIDKNPRSDLTTTAHQVKIMFMSVLHERSLCATQF